MKIKNIVKLIVVILVCQLAGVFGSLFTTPMIPIWYETLQKPSFAPPNWLIGPVWIVLYTLMGISLFLVWDKGLKNKDVKTSIYTFSVQLTLNALWSYLFFGIPSPFFAFIEIIILWFAIALTIFKFYKVSRNAAFLLIPYILWVSFAMILNFYIWRLNP